MIKHNAGFVKRNSGENTDISAVIFHIYHKKAAVRPINTNVFEIAQKAEPQAGLRRNASAKPPWYEAYARKLHQLTGISLTEKQSMAQYTDRDGNVQATPFLLRKRCRHSSSSVSRSSPILPLWDFPAATTGGT